MTEVLSNTDSEKELSLSLFRVAFAANQLLKQ